MSYCSSTVNRWLGSSTIYVVSYCEVVLSTSKCLSTPAPPSSTVSHPLSNPQTRHFPCPWLASLRLSFTSSTRAQFSRPCNSFLFNSYVDPLTAVLQRIKGLVTGSLPRLVNIGHNCTSASIAAEDSIVIPTTDVLSSPAVEHSSKFHLDGRCSIIPIWLYDYDLDLRRGSTHSQ